MKNSNLIITHLAKAFQVDYAADYIQPLTDDLRTEDILYDIYFAPADEEKGEDAVVLFKYEESTTGVHLLHVKPMQTLWTELSPWASDADVRLYAEYINALMAKHRWAKLYFSDGSLRRRLTDEDVIQMQTERKTYLKRLIAKKQDFTMEGIRGDLFVTNEDLDPSLTLDEQLQLIQRYFLKIQWEKR